MIDLKSNIKIIIAIGVAASVGAAAAHFWGISTPTEPKQKVWTPAQDPITNTPIVDIKVKKGTVRVKKSADATLKIPLNPNEGVISASSIASNDHPVTVATIIDTDTGISRTVVREEPLPWFALTQKGEAGIYYGLKNGAPSTMLQVRQEILQVKAVRMEAIGQVTQSIVGLDSYIGIGLTYRW